MLKNLIVGIYQELKLGKDLGIEEKIVGMITVLILDYILD